MGGWGLVRGFGFAMIALVVELGLMIAALPGLFARKMSGWQLLFYAQLASFVFSVLSGSIIGALVGGLISMYILFQVRPLYTA